MCRWRRGIGAGEVEGEGESEGDGEEEDEDEDKKEEIVEVAEAGASPVMDGRANAGHSKALSLGAGTSTSI